MNILSIKYFLAIVEEGNISAAARKLFISQQTLSEHVKKLEDELNTPLFARGRKISLTLAGETFATSARELIGQYDDILSEIEDITKKRRQRITVAIPTCTTPAFLADIILAYKTKYPNCEVTVLKRQHNDVVHNMEGVDLYLSYLPLSDGLENVPLIAHDPYCVTFHRSLAERVYGERWTQVEEQLILNQDLSVIKELPFLLQRDRYLRLAEDMRLIFDEYGFNPDVAINSESSGLNEIFCQQGIDCLLAAESHISRRFFHGDSIPMPDLLSYPIKVRSFDTKLCISYKKGKRLHTAERRFIEEAKLYFSEGNQQNI